MQFGPLRPFSRVLKAKLFFKNFFFKVKSVRTESPAQLWIFLFVLVSLFVWSCFWSYVVASLSSWWFSLLLNLSCCWCAVRLVSSVLIFPGGFLPARRSAEASHREEMLLNLQGGVQGLLGVLRILEEGRELLAVCPPRAFKGITFVKGLVQTGEMEGEEEPEITRDLKKILVGLGSIQVDTGEKGPQSLLRWLEEGSTVKVGLWKSEGSEERRRSVERSLQALLLALRNELEGSKNDLRSSLKKIKELFWGSPHAFSYIGSLENLKNYIKLWYPCEEFSLPLSSSVSPLFLRNFFGEERLTGLIMRHPRVTHSDHGVYVVYCNPNLGFFETFLHSSGMQDFYFDSLQSVGVDVIGLVLWNYRGYGKAARTTSSRVCIGKGILGWSPEEMLLRDSEELLTFLTEKKGMKNILLHGRSIGGAPALHLASRFEEVKCVFLDRTFSSLSKAGGRLMGAWAGRALQLVGMEVENLEPFEKVPPRVLKIVVDDPEDEVIHHAAGLRAAIACRFVSRPPPGVTPPLSLGSDFLGQVTASIMLLETLQATLEAAIGGGMEESFEFSVLSLYMLLQASQAEERSSFSTPSAEGEEMKEVCAEGKSPESRPKKRSFLGLRGREIAPSSADQTEEEALEVLRGSILDALSHLEGTELIGRGDGERADWLTSALQLRKSITDEKMMDAGGSSLASVGRGSPLQFEENRELLKEWMASLELWGACCPPEHLSPQQIKCSSLSLAEKADFEKVLSCRVARVSPCSLSLSAQQSVSEKLGRGELAEFRRDLSRVKAEEWSLKISSQAAELASAVARELGDVEEPEGELQTVASESLLSRDFGSSVSFGTLPLHVWRAAQILECFAFRISEHLKTRKCDDSENPVFLISSKAGHNGSLGEAERFQLASILKAFFGKVGGPCAGPVLPPAQLGKGAE